MEIRLLKKTKAKLQAQNEEAEKKLAELTDKICEATKNLSDIAQDAISYRELADKEKRIIAEQLRQAKKEYNDFMENEMQLMGSYYSLQEVGLEYTEKFESLDEIESRLINIEQKIGSMVKDESCIVTTRKYTVNNSDSKGKAFQSNYGKNLIIGLNAVYNKEAKPKSLDLYTAKTRIVKAHIKYNKQAELLGINISNQYTNLLLKAIELKYSLKKAKEEEKAKIRKEKQQLREQEKLLAEAEKERKRLEEEKKAMDIAFAKALSDAEREDIKSQLEAIDKRIADIDYRVNNRQAGYLYIISSPALDGMIKIGCTRRLNPTIRVKELSSSSLPFPFVTHGFVFSDNCFELEANMHKYFEAYRVHPDREFFYVNPKEAVDVLKNKFNCEVHFEDIDEEEVCLES